MGWGRIERDEEKVIKLAKHLGMIEEKTGEEIRKLLHRLVVLSQNINDVQPADVRMVLQKLSGTISPLTDDKNENIRSRAQAIKLELDAAIMMINEGKKQFESASERIAFLRKVISQCDLVVKLLTAEEKNLRDLLEVLVGDKKARGMGPW